MTAQQSLEQMVAGTGIRLVSIGSPKHRAASLAFLLGGTLLASCQSAGNGGDAQSTGGAAQGTGGKQNSGGAPSSSTTQGRGGEPNSSTTQGSGGAPSSSTTQGSSIAQGGGVSSSGATANIGGNATGGGTAAGGKLGIGGATLAAGANGKGGSTVGSGGVSENGGVVGKGGTIGSLNAGTAGKGSGAKAGQTSQTSQGGQTGPGGASTGPGTSASCPATATLKAGDSTRKLTVGSTSRSYLLHVPSSYTGKSAVPLVLDFHGLGSSGSNQKSSSGYLSLSDKEGFIIAYPEGIDQAWNIGPCCTTSRTVDDLGFAKAIVSSLEADGCIDAKHVYTTGFSMGGGMTLYLACNAADVFTAAVANSFDLLADSEEPCKPARPIPVLTMRGTADPIVPYAGGASNPPNGLNVTIHFLGAVATEKRWAELDGCTGTSATASNGCDMYTRCNAGVQVGLCTSSKSHQENASEATTGWEFMKSFAGP